MRAVNVQSSHSLKTIRVWFWYQLKTAIIQFWHLLTTALLYYRTNYEQRDLISTSVENCDSSILTSSEDSDSPIHTSSEDNDSPILTFSEDSDSPILTSSEDHDSSILTSSEDRDSSILTPRVRSFNVCFLLPCAGSAIGLSPWRGRRLEGKKHNRKGGSGKEGRGWWRHTEKRWKRCDIHVYFGIFWDNLSLSNSFYDIITKVVDRAHKNTIRIFCE